MRIEEIIEFSVTNKKDAGIILLGQDFEKNALHLLYKDVSKKYLNKYTKSKLSSFDTSYIKNLSFLDIEKIKKLLYICRFCSYFGKNYFSDFIVINDDFYLAQQIKESIDNEVFILLCKLLGFEVRIYSEKEEKYSIDLSLLLNSCMNTQPYSAYWKALKNVSLENDEKEKLDYDMKKLPFYVIEKWLDKKEVEKEDLEEHMKFLEQSNKEEKKHFEDLEKQLNHKEFDDLDYPIKIEYLKSKFSISEFKAIELAEFIETKD